MNDDRLPLSEEVFNQIVVRISEGDWVEGEKLPSESQLCEMFHVSRISVRAALQKLKGHHHQTWCGVFRLPPGKRQRTGRTVDTTDRRRSFPRIL